MLQQSDLLTLLVSLVTLLSATFFRFAFSVLSLLLEKEYNKLSFIVQK